MWTITPEARQLWACFVVFEIGFSINVQAGRLRYGAFALMKVLLDVKRRLSASPKQLSLMR
jgi:hypothetical protein